MSMTDPIADFLTRIRNGIMAAHETVEIPSSQLKKELARILRELSAGRLKDAGTQETFREARELGEGMVLGILEAQGAAVQ
jgi:small subunit ribosomal protein S8